MRNRRFGIEIYFIIALLFVIMMGSILFIVHSHTDKIISELIFSKMIAANHSIANNLREFEAEAVARADIIANNELVLDELKNGNTAMLVKTLSTLGTGLDFVAVYEADGALLAGAHISKVKSYYIQWFKSGADMPGLDAGISRFGYVTGVGPALYASAAIYQEDRLIGIALCGYDLSKPEYLQQFKEQNDCEVTLFYGDVRINATIKDESGHYPLGLKADATLIQTVLESQSILTGRRTLFGRTFAVCYAPIVFEEQAVGILFTGMDIMPTLERQRVMNYWIIATGVVGMGMAAVLFFGIGHFNKIFAHTLEELTIKKESLTVLEKVLHGLDTLVYVIDPETNAILFANARLQAHFGLDTGIIGECCWKVFHPGENQACDYCALPVLRTSPAEPLKREVFNTVTKRFYRHIDRMSDWPDGRKVLFCQRIDIHEEKQAQEKLMQMSSIVQSAPHFTAYKKLTGECLYVNPAASALTGYSHQELMQDYIALLFDAETARFLRQDIPAALQAQDLINYEVKATLKDGETRIFSACSFRVDPEVKAFGTIATDITEKRQLEDKLRGALEKAEQGSRAKSDFLSKMSHEMRTPMNAIIGMAALTQKTDAIYEAQGYAEKIEAAAAHLLAIINDILDMSNLETGAVTLSPEAFAVQDMLTQISAVMGHYFKEKKQHFTITQDENLPTTLVWDKQKLMQVILNLLSNAHKFTPKNGHIQLSLTQGCTSENPHGIRIAVTDDGIGIPEEQQARLYDAFEQLDNSINRQYGGTGLGLTIAQKIVHLMGGEIQVVSKPGEGAQFSFTITPTAAIAETNPETEVDEETGNRLFTGKWLLLVDDIEINRDILAALLDETGVNIDFAENGSIACKKYAADPNRYDLILMDIHMPEMNGYEAAEAIRHMHTATAQTIPIIAVTADVSVTEIAKAGMNGFVEKPVFADALVEKIKPYLQGLVN